MVAGHKRVCGGGGNEAEGGDDGSGLHVECKFADRIVRIGVVVVCVSVKGSVEVGRMPSTVRLYIHFFEV